MELLEKVGQEIEITPKHTGWKSVITLSRWQKYGKDRLYVNYRHYDRQGKCRYHGSEKGYIDLVSGEVVGAPSFKKMIARIAS